MNYYLCNDSTVKSILATFNDFIPNEKLFIITLKKICDNFIQSVLFGIGLVLVGVPATGLWVLLSLIFGIIQIGVFPVVIPAVIYVFATGSTFTSIAFLIWSIIIMLLDNILKPILLGRSAVVPTLIIFIGSMGGFIHSGIVGLFTGAIIFSIGYKLFLFWMGGINNKSETK